MRNIEKYEKAVLDSLSYCVLDRKLENVDTGLKEDCSGKNCNACKKQLREWLLSEYKEPILDEVEKRYLRGVIRPFRNMVAFIKKTCNCAGFQWIEIAVKGNKTIALPGFKNDKMYKGMKLEKEYTLEELGL